MARDAATFVDGAAKDPAFAALKALKNPVLVVNGTDDIVIPTINSHPAAVPA